MFFILKLRPASPFSSFCFKIVVLEIELLPKARVTKEQTSNVDMTWVMESLKGNQTLHQLFLGC